MDQILHETTVWLFRLEPVDVTRYAASFFALQAMPVPPALEEHMHQWGTDARALLLSAGPDHLPCLSPWAAACTEVLIRARLTFSAEGLCLHLCRMAAMHWLLSLTVPRS